jgi:CRP-like cAMP-binding protein
MNPSADPSTASTATAQSEAPARSTPHERLIGLGLRPIGHASQFAPDIQALMSKNPLFAGLDDKETLMLCGFMYVYETPGGVTLISEGEPGDFMLLLMQGTADVVRRNRHNHRARIAVASPGHALGEMSMFDGEPRFASCVSLEPCRVAVLTRDALLLALHDEPRLGNKLLFKLVQLLSDRLRQTTSKLVTFLEGGYQT